MLPGDAPYWGPNPSNGYYGHTGIYTGPDEFTSATFYGIQTYRISTWDAPLLGFIRYWS